MTSLLMAQISGRGLECLPIELQCGILQQLSSLKDIHALIRASPDFYRAFRQVKSNALGSSLRQTIHPDAMQDAIAAVRASKILHQTVKHARGNPDVKSLRKNIVHFLDKYQARRDGNKAEDYCDSSALMPLCRLSRNVDFFVNDFASKTLNALPRSPTGPETLDAEIDFCSPRKVSRSCYLSETEKGRLQRAFFRFEIYRKLFYEPEYGEMLFSRAEQSELLHKIFYPWEMEELSCISHYLVDTLGAYIVELEDHFIEQVISAKDCSPDAVHRPSTAPDGVCKVCNERMNPSTIADYLKKTRQTEYSKMNNLELFYLDIFDCSQESGFHAQHISALMSRGLPFLQQFFTLDECDRKELACHEAYRQQCVFLPDILGWPQEDLQAREPKVQSGCSRGKESLRYCNKGWLEGLQVDQHPTLYNLEHNFEFRNRGYVFWDEERLRSTKLFFDTAPIAYRRMVCRAARPSVSKQFGNAEIRSCVLRKLAPRRFRDANDNLFPDGEWDSAREDLSLPVI
ncbi:MAG: hypothetical protein M1825_002469 [Sarcosagium campestre]|nr:MAG: hypothetical protein M1825_002469 [Sarcosagium campestre]